MIRGIFRLISCCIVSSEIIPRELRHIILLDPEISAIWWQSFDGLTPKDHCEMTREIFHYFLGVIVSHWIGDRLMNACLCATPSQRCFHCQQFSEYSLVDTAWCVRQYARMALMEVDWELLMVTILSSCPLINSHSLARMLPCRMTRQSVLSLIGGMSPYIGIRDRDKAECSLYLAHKIRNVCQR